MKWYKEGLVYAAMVWSLLFAAMSFYWAAGGMLGVESLGGAIYHKAMEREPAFVRLVWVTGVVKVGGALLLLILLKVHLHTKMRKGLSIVCIAAGAFMTLYGLVNFITISLAGLNVLDFEISDFALKWRLIFWEPFWVAGGILYILAGSKLFFQVSGKR